VKRLAVALAACLVVMGCQTTEPAAEPPDPCLHTANDIRNTLDDRFPDVTEIRVSDREDVDAFLKRFNSQEPRTYLEASEIYVFHSKKANRRQAIDTSILTLVDDRGCVGNSGEVKTRDLLNWLSQGPLVKT